LKAGWTDSQGAGLLTCRQYGSVLMMEVISLSEPANSLQTSAARPAVAGGDRRSRQRQKRRDAVFASAVELFTEHGYEKTTMEAIAIQADVARATVFNHFPRKVEFIHEWAHRRRSRASAAVHGEHLDDHHVSEVLERYMQELGSINTENRAETVALMGAAVHFVNVFADPALGHQLADYVMTGKARGEVRADVDAAQCGLLLAAGYFATLSNWITLGPVPFDLTQELVKALTIFLYGTVIAPDSQS
jgi:AcrR family transcriptional regulator